MPDTLESVLIGGVSGMVSAVITYFGTRSKIRLELAAEYDKDLRKSRLETYKELWAILEPLARYGRTASITHAVLRDISEKTRVWYFRNGGIYITRSSRRPYFSWKAAMQPILDNPEYLAKPDQELPAEVIAPVVDAGSRLRTSLSDDVGTKERSLV
jgi:hypothetical protein